MRLLLVGNFFRTPGTAMPCIELAARLRAAGAQVATCSTWRARPVRLLDMASAPLRWRGRYDVALVDVFSGPSFLWAEAAAEAAARIGKPYVLTLHGGALPAFAERWPGRVRRLLERAAAVVSPSGYLRHELSPYRADIRLIPNPLALEAYAFHARERPRPVLVWLRAFHEVYAPSLAVEVLARVRERQPGARLKMFGPDKGDGSLTRARELARALGVAEAIEFLGSVPKAEVAKALHSGDVFLNTARVDNTPVTVLEAMACGLPVVCSRVGGTPYLLREGEDALLVPPEDAAAFAAATLALLEPTTGLATRLVHAARRRVEAFDWEVVLGQWLGLLGQIRPVR